jgi:hypothetical protein
MLLEIALLSLGIAACGKASDRAGSSSSSSSSSNSSASHLSPGALASKLYRAAHASQLILPEPAQDQPHLANDGDNEQPGDEDSDNSFDVDNDGYADHQPIPNNSVYHDADDRAALAFGKAASARDRQAVVALVESYYAVAAADDGRRACSMIDAALAQAAPSDYGKFGPAYLHGGKTCAAVLTLLFRHEHRRLPPAIQVTGVRVGGGGGFALFGSKTTPASEISVKRQGGSWKVGALIGFPLT